MYTISQCLSGVLKQENDALSELLFCAVEMFVIFLYLDTSLCVIF